MTQFSTFSGKGYPIDPINTRRTPVRNGEPSQLPIPDQLVLGGNKPRVVREIVIDLSAVFTDRPYAFSGTTLHYSTASATTAGPLRAKPDDISNGAVNLIYGSSINLGKTFAIVYISNPTAQAGVTATLNIYDDSDGLAPVLVDN